MAATLPLPRRLAAGLVALVAISVGHASGSSLALSSAAMAAQQESIATCDATVTVDWTTIYDPGIDGLIVDDVQLTGVDEACDGQVFQVTLAAIGSNDALGSGLYADPPGADGQISPTGGSNQTVTFDIASQLVQPLLVGLKAWSISP